METLLALRALKLFAVLWALSLILHVVVATRDGSFGAVTVAEAFGFAVFPFLVGLLALVVLRNRRNGGWWDALFIALFIFGLASWGYLSR